MYIYIYIYIEIYAYMYAHECKLCGIDDKAVQEGFCGSKYVLKGGLKPAELLPTEACLAEGHLGG